jgi:hypothetical protein
MLPVELMHDAEAPVIVGNGNGYMVTFFTDAAADAHELAPV